MHDVAHALGQALAQLALEAEALSLDVPGYGNNPPSVDVAPAEKRTQRGAQALLRFVGISRPYKRVDVAVGALEVAGEKLHAQEASSAREQKGTLAVVRAWARHRIALSARSSSTDSSRQRASRSASGRDARSA